MWPGRRLRLHADPRSGCGRGRGPSAHAVRRGCGTPPGRSSPGRSRKQSSSSGSLRAPSVPALKSVPSDCHLLRAEGVVIVKPRPECSRLDPSVPHDDTMPRPERSSRAPEGDNHRKKPTRAGDRSGRTDFLTTKYTKYTKKNPSIGPVGPSVGPFLFVYFVYFVVKNRRPVRPLSQSRNGPSGPFAALVVQPSSSSVRGRSWAKSR